MSRIFVEATRVTNLRYKALCPLHSERTPSLSIDGYKGEFRCFGCDAAGVAESHGPDLFELIRK